MDNLFETYFWIPYPRRKSTPTIQGNKTAIEKKLTEAVKAGKTTWEDIKISVEKYAKSDKVDQGFVQMPETWVNKEGWNYEYEIPQTPEEILAAKPLAERTEEEWWKILGVADSPFLKDFLPRHWRSSDGPPPGSQHCMVPDEIIEKCGWRKYGT